MEVEEFSDLLYNLKIINQQLTYLFENEMGVSLTRYQILMYLKENSPCIQRKLCDTLQIDGAAITRHLKILEQGGYIKRSRNEQNNREMNVEITEYAKVKIDNCEKEYDLNNILNSEFTHDDLKNLVSLLNKF
ncbi:MULTISPECIES: MarR family winged helix-turn-helix transcriptional regulator [Gemella]|uniref:MarR family winged helix-turn-helix transcriptional regulator n=1 Tax=Gemella TaxID=1378 RepID=UPI0007684D34|nr:MULTISPECIES: MarR family winged helix-turn-helix transcriptional regulator [Gemella]AME09207.1 MarR family transcriptional regulator [Gemella sp. oral taxon 928]AXI26840.1 MarR family transcriptional regulator [Gemella sp. ND 6198]